MTDVIGTGQVDAPLRRRPRLPRWVTWAGVLAVLIAVFVVPTARSKLADRSAEWLQRQWASRSAYDDARAAVIEQVDSRAGALDERVGLAAAAVADHEEAAALTEILRRISARRTWAGDVARARDAAAAALRLEVAALLHDAVAARPTDGYLFAPAVDKLVAIASARITSMARDRHLPRPAVVGAELAPARSALAELQRPTDFPTGLAVIAGQNRPEVVDLDTGAVSQLPRPGEFGMEFWGGWSMRPTPHGVRVFDAHGRLRAVLGHTAAQPLSDSGLTIWLRSSRGVRRFTRSGRPVTTWVRPPIPWNAVGAADRFVLLAHVVDEGPVKEQLWDPVTGVRRALPPTCFGGWTAGGHRLVALPCDGDRTVATIDLATTQLRRLRLPAPASAGVDAVLNPLSPSGDDIALTLEGDNGVQVKLLNLTTGKLTPSPVDSGLPPAAWSTDGEWLLLADQAAFAPGQRAPQCALWRPRDGRTTSVRLPPGTPLVAGAPLLTPADD